jgi:mannose-6-phosphate isomerase-like protein (cupin superfamily)
MRAGAVVTDETETFTILRSAADGGGCEMELVVAPGASGPPLHTHEEPETIEVISGSVVFTLDGVDRTFLPGDTLIIPPGCIHTFRNPSRTEPLRARGVHGGRFERLVDQIAAGGPVFLRLALYLSSVDPRASHMVSPAIRVLMRLAAHLARLRGIEVAPPTGAYGR